MTKAITDATFTVQPDGFTVNAVAAVAAQDHTLCFAWGDGFMSQCDTSDPTASHVYAEAGDHAVVVTCNGYQVRKTVTTTVTVPVPANRFPGTPAPPPPPGP